jgi:hypothetical protein
MSETASSLSTRDATSIKFWQELCPDLSIEGPGTILPATLPDERRVLNLLVHEGYVNEPGVLPDPVVRLLLSGIQRLVERNIPPAFIYVYDEPWAAFRSLSPFLEKVLGADFRLMAGLWAWYVRPLESDAGWRPHRDGFSASAPKEKPPDALTVWLALTDASCLNGCMYVVPAHWDESAPPNGSSEREVVLSDRELQNVRALPAPAGSMVAWNHSIIHWGGRASSRAANPRCSIALMFRRLEEGPANSAWIRLHEMPSFQKRLGLVGHYVRVYPNRFAIEGLKNPSIQLLAAALEWKYWERPAK